MKSLPKAIYADLMKLENGDVRTYWVVLDNGREMHVRARTSAFTPEFLTLAAKTYDGGDKLLA